MSAETQWVWWCPACGDYGFTEGAKPTFSRCLACDSSAKHGEYPPPLRMQTGLQDLMEWTHKHAIIRTIEIIEEEMARTNPKSGHGKAQRYFGRKLLDRLAQE